MRLDKGEILAQASGRWDEIYIALAPALRDAVANKGKHGTCPVHGGKDGFRIFPNKDDGSCICNTCGAMHNGIDTLMWVNGWGFREALGKVHDFLNLSQTPNDVLIPPKEAKQYVGKLAFKGELDVAGKSRYGITLESLDGNVETVYGVDLKNKLVDVEIGEFVEITLLGTKKLTKGRMYVYSVRKIQNPVTRESQIKDTYAKAKPISGTQAQAYLNNRGIRSLSEADSELLRFSYLKAKVEDGVKSFPTLVAPVTDVDGKLITLHRTFLDSDGQPQKASITDNKRLVKLPYGKTIKGASIKLGGMPENGILAVAEGIETALSVQMATGLPCWSTISANGLEQVQLPESVHTVFIFADKDESGVGEESAKVLQKRLKENGVNAFIFLPKSTSDKAHSLDWNDVLKEEGKEGFPFV